VDDLVDLMEVLSSGAIGPANYNYVEGASIDWRDQPL